MILCRIVLAGGLVLALLPMATHAEEKTPANTLSAQEKEQGWKLLFDGRSTDGWRAYHGKQIGDRWKVTDGVLAFKPKEGKRGGDILTVEQFESFEFALEWRVTPGANSGIMYRVAESEDSPYMTGPEYQILDNTRHADGKNPKTSAGSCYALYAPEKDVTRPVGEWNQTRIVAKGNQIEHWLNGTRTVAFEMGSKDWNARVSGSKFREWKKFGTMAKGHIDLQDHGDEVHYRNIKIRIIP